MNLDLQRVAYCSHALRPELALQTLAEILAVSDRNNARDRLSGVLLISRGRFFQVLEGARQDLDRTLRRIEADPRHRDIRFVSRQDIQTRLFDQWGMVAARITPSRQPEIDGVIDRCHTDPEAAIQAARALLDDQRAA
ncbi:BLUF domain-containing protein [Brevundimonas sp. GCM10030266]|uniref:BLUF domain-containing protein n=1 Tax=Brevundimonas sp. GCM10030266 TaxID=3273386 RepID=UPI003609EC5A